VTAAAVSPATPADIAALAVLHRRVRSASLAWLPDLHTPAEDLAFFRDKLFPASTVLVARAPALLGYCAFRPGWIDHLYIDTAAQRQGLGTRLLAAALAGQAQARLWVFQRNSAAIAFYRRHGFTEERCTDGSRNEEGEPDILMAWSQS
jgi:ribosomal protein S18 acetylase RimI-like enzyme